MGAIKDEAVGSAKKVAGKVTGNDELRDKGEAQEHRGIEQDHKEQAHRLGGTSLDQPETHDGGQPGDGPSGLGDA